MKEGLKMKMNRRQTFLDQMEHNIAQIEEIKFNSKRAKFVYVFILTGAAEAVLARQRHRMTSFIFAECTSPTKNSSVH